MPQQAEIPMYGSSRLGQFKPDFDQFDHKEFYNFEDGRIPDILSEGIIINNELVFTSSQSFCFNLAVFPRPH